MSIGVVFEVAMGVAIVGLIWALMSGKRGISSKLSIAMSGCLGAMHLTKDYAVPVTVSTVIGAMLVIMALAAPLLICPQRSEDGPDATDLRR